MLQTRVQAWDTELMNVLDVRPEQFPPLGDLHERVQGLTPKYASAWPALRNVPWFPATGVYPSRDHEASARGAALLALEAMGILSDVAQVPPSLEQPVKPDAEKHAVYRKAAERQQKLYQELLEGK
jgi:sugar (pentulose or hexulose) kinase